MDLVWDDGDVFIAYLQPYEEGSQQRSSLPRRHKNSYKLIKDEIRTHLDMATYRWLLSCFVVSPVVLCFYVFNILPQIFALMRMFFHEEPFCPFWKSFFCGLLQFCSINNDIADVMSYLVVYLRLLMSFLLVRDSGWQQSFAFSWYLKTFLIKSCSFYAFQHFIFFLWCRDSHKQLLPVL